MEINKAKMQELCDEYLEDGKPYWNYSGRGMYGKNCFGIVGNTADLSAFLMDVLPVYYDEETDGAVPKEWRENARDNMGLDMIFYWPGIETVEDAPEDAHPADVKYENSDHN